MGDSLSNLDNLLIPVNEFLQLGNYLSNLARLEKITWDAIKIRKIDDHRPNDRQIFVKQSH